MNLGVGEALVSTLQAKGAPSIVERTLIRPPSSRLGPLTEKERKDLIDMSPVGAQYNEAIDRESAFEVLQKRAEEAAKKEEEQREREEREEEVAESRRGDYDHRNPWSNPWGEPASPRAPYRKSSTRSTSTRRSNRQTVTEAAIKSLTRTVATQLGRALVRGILGGLKRGR